MVGRYGEVVWSNRVSFDTWLEAFKHNPILAFSSNTTKRLFKSLRRVVNAVRNWVRAAAKTLQYYSLKFVLAAFKHYLNHREKYDLMLIMLVSYAAFGALFFLLFGYLGFVFFNKIVAIFSGIGFMFTISELFDKNKSAA